MNGQCSPKYLTINRKIPKSQSNILFYQRPNKSKFLATMSNYEICCNLCSVVDLAGPRLESNQARSGNLPEIC